jgi:hypothetical protein
MATLLADILSFHHRISRSALPLIQTDSYCGVRALSEHLARSLRTRPSLRESNRTLWTLQALFQQHAPSLARSSTLFALPSPLLSIACVLLPIEIPGVGSVAQPKISTNTLTLAPPLSIWPTSARVPGPPDAVVAYVMAIPRPMLFQHLPPVPRKQKNRYAPS